MFGLYTKMKNDTNDTSQIRFGGYNERLFKRDSEGKVSHELIWIPTISKTSWKIECRTIDFNNDHILGKSTKALLNPGFPFISAPI